MCVFVMTVFVDMFVFMPVMMMPAFGMRRAFMHAEFHPFDVLSLLPLEVHVEVADVELRQLPFERRRFDAEIAKRTDRHVAANARKAVEVEYFHRLLFRLDETSRKLTFPS